MSDTGRTGTPTRESVFWYLAVTMIAVIPMFWLIYQYSGIVEATLGVRELSIIAVTAAAVIIALVLPAITYPFFKDVLRALADRKRREDRER